MAKQKKTVEVLENYVQYDENIVNEFREKMYSIIPKEYFQEKFDKRTPNVIKVATIRETTGYLINRSTEPDEVISTSIGDKDVVVIPSRKLKSREKLTGLVLCRKFNVVHPEIEYNFIKKSGYLANPNSIIFGDSVTQSNDSVGLPSRIIYEWAYSIRDKDDITEELTHNALSEEGTMWDKDEGSQRQSLFEVQYIKPGAYFPQFITFYDITPEGFIHALISHLKTTRYGAQSNVMDANMKNEIVAIALDTFEPPVSSYLISKEFDGDVSYENVKEFIINKLNENSSITVKHDELKDIIGLIGEYLKDDEKLKQLYLKMLDDSIKYMVECKILKDKDVKKLLGELGV
ncbi:MAG: CRISPR-associated protein Csc2 [Methanothermococcus sp.]|jgi:CRISPR-associated protein Csc2|uniref:type I-D CRISPR-associated protein Cas7/Csc2 n=1 Tax=Methanothermococcus sp. TaxID=2614238 RepID=UPI0025829B64|nr:type I-D CRISPR-associated protein Cas7/Csc2 [Methanothermococcus sp.]MDK2790243.1 CRISPR-associated protein Csc2 [Methanothermococcus sp.]MDK2987655.1 CRISPR-associated protein Csc2 [Methanothermococcus sp.]